MTVSNDQGNTICKALRKGILYKSRLLSLLLLYTTTVTRTSYTTTSLLLLLRIFQQQPKLNKQIM